MAIKLTERERILRTYRRQDVDRVPMIDTAWAGTIRRWHQEGMPKNVEWTDYFGFDKVISLRPDNSPRFPIKVSEENDRYKIETTRWGEKQPCVHSDPAVAFFPLLPFFLPYPGFDQVKLTGVHALSLLPNFFSYHS